MYLSLNPSSKPGDDTFVAFGFSTTSRNSAFVTIPTLFIILNKMLSEKLAKKVLLRAVKMGLFDSVIAFSL